MSDWTPTTKQVRDGYRFDPEDEYRHPLQASANAESAGRDFDRWLQQVKAEAWDEGRAAGWAEDCAYDAPNPYRQETDA